MLSFVENVSDVIEGQSWWRSRLRRRRLRRKRVRWVGPLSWVSFGCADDDEGAGEGRFRKLESAGTLRLLERVWPVLAIFAAILGAQLEVAGG